MDLRKLYVSGPNTDIWRLNVLKYSGWYATSERCQFNGNDIPWISATFLSSKSRHWARYPICSTGNISNWTLSMCEETAVCIFWLQSDTSNADYWNDLVKCNRQIHLTPGILDDWLKIIVLHPISFSKPTALYKKSFPALYSHLLVHQITISGKRNFWAFTYYSCADVWLDRVALHNFAKDVVVAVAAKTLNSYRYIKLSHMEWSPCQRGFYLFCLLQHIFYILLFFILFASWTNVVCLIPSYFLPGPLDCAFLVGLQYIDT